MKFLVVVTSPSIYQKGNVWGTTGGDSGTKIVRKTIKKERILPINVHTGTAVA